MKDQAFHMTMLYDFYGDLLTERQKEFYDLYHNEDLSLAEIAENYGISRQGVRDVIIRAEAILNDFEEKTGFVARWLKVRSALEDLRGLTEEAEELNERRIHNPRLAQITEQMKAQLSGLEE